MSSPDSGLEISRFNGATACFRFHSMLDRNGGHGLSSPPMNPEEIMRRIELLRQEHRDLDSAITALAHSGSADQLQLARLKKRKLMLRDEIALLEDSLIPDIIA